MRIPGSCSWEMTVHKASRVSCRHPHNRIDRESVGSGSESLAGYELNFLGGFGLTGVAFFRRRTTCVSLCVSYSVHTLGMFWPNKPTWVLESETAFVFRKG